MTRRLFLIVEDKTDVEVFKRFLKLRNLSITVVPFHPKTGQAGLSRLRELLEGFIQTALAQRQPGDCIVILHDADEQTQPHQREDYNQIKARCENYANQSVHHLIAHDEIESWLLSDEGLCQWLGLTAKNQDKQRQPSERLSTRMNKQGKGRYTGPNRENVLAHLNGNCHSESFKQAFKQLEEAGCLGS
jgi:hypothetical protein